MRVLDFAALTDTGPVRELNEDSMLAAPPVFVVADGLGGQDSGELASQAVVGQFAALAEQARGGTVDAAAVAATLAAAHEQVLALHRPGQLGGAATTACGAVVVSGDEGPQWLLFNVGDSRVYRRSPGSSDLTQVSVDHSLVQELVDAGVIDAAEAVFHPERNIVTRALGGEGGSEPDFWRRPLVTGERLVLCSDGLLDGPDPATLAATAVTGSAAEAARALLQLALDSGSQDNVTVIVVDVLDSSVPAKGQQ